MKKLFPVVLTSTFCLAAQGNVQAQKIELEANYYVEQPDAFGPEWMVGINLTPVVPNFINNWIRGNQSDAWFYWPKVQ